MAHFPLLVTDLQFEQDVVAVRQRARMLAEELGFESQDQTRIATSVSEIARNAYRYTGSGRVLFEVTDTPRGTAFMIEVADKGKGIDNLDDILAGKYRSTTGMGMGLIGTQRLMDLFAIDSSTSGTKVSVGKLLPPRAGKIDSKTIDRIAKKLTLERPVDPLSEVQRQNRELMTALDELRKKQEELSTLNRELEDTNKGVVALYAELDEKADHLRRADELKSRFLSNMSHEFRTPLNSILGLSRILLEEADGPLTSEQTKQIGFISKAAGDLRELVNDLLDLAKVEAGKIVVQPIAFELESLFGALRGMLRPLLLTESVALVFEDVEGIPELFTDEGKVSQILRNLISNALKFTERGEVRIGAAYDQASDTITINVSDTGIGIGDEFLDTIFQEFTQVDSPMQRSVKGTGLGLPLSRRLAELLGGDLLVESTLGSGSTFTVRLPRVLRISEPEVTSQARPDVSPSADIILVEDNEADLHILQNALSRSSYQVIPIRTVKEVRNALASSRPKVVVLDILLRGENSWNLLKEIKQMPAPPKVLVITTIEDQGKAFALGADGYILKPIDPNDVRSQIDSLLSVHDREVALVVDDEEISRYIAKQLLEQLGYQVTTAANGVAAIETASLASPSVILLDLVMPGISGADVLKRLKEDEATRAIPTIIYTSKELSREEHDELAQLADLVLKKDIATRENALEVLREALDKLSILPTSA